MSVNENKEMPQLEKSAFSESSTKEGETQSKEVKKKTKEKNKSFYI